MGADSGIGVVGDAGGYAGTALHDDLVALGEEFLDRFRRGGHAGFPGVGFEWDTDVHGQIFLDNIVVAGGRIAQTSQV
ncbi:hypothetical protein D3C78_917150 [compost metagenome]